MEKAENFVNEFGGEIYQAHWRDGWYNCELKGRCWDEFTPNYEDYGDDYMVIDSEEELNEQAMFIFNELKKTDEEVLEMDEEEKEEYEKELTASDENGNKLIERCQNIDWELESVILNCGEFYETVPKKSMDFYYDTHHYSIGVFLSNDFSDGEETEEEL